MLHEQVRLEVFEIVGFDFGHGETALAKTTSEAAGAEPEMLEINGQKNQVTALGLTNRSERLELVGENAIKSPDVQQLYIGFKPQRHQFDAPEPDRLKTIKRFLRTYVDLLSETKQLRERTLPQFIVGIPSGWTAREQYEYLKLLQDAGMSRVRVEKESRAAFLQIKESKTFDVRTEDLLQRILIVDVGSSTTDFTIVSNLETQLLEDFGDDIGAGLIDEVIFERTLQRIENTQPEEKARLEKVFQGAFHHQRRCLLSCRKGKEEYFSRSQNYPTALHCVECSRKIRTVRPAIEFDPLIYADEMEKVLNTPIPALQQRSWKTAFTDALREAQARIGARQPNLLILTGGASRMPFVMDLCQEVFGEAEVFLRGPEPEFTIAKGLARIGRIDFLTNQFKQTIAKLEESDDLRELLGQKVPLLVERLLGPLAETLLTVAIRPVLFDWREGHVDTLQNIPATITARKSVYADQVSQRARQVLKKWYDDDLLPGLIAFTNPICRQFDIPRSALDLHDKNLVVGEETIKHIPLSTDTIIERNMVEGIIVVIAGLIVGMITGGSGLALLGLPLIGQIIAGTVAAAFAAGGVKAVEKKIKTMNLPVSFRKVLLSEKKIENILHNQRAGLVSSIKTQMLAEPLWMQHLKEAILLELKHALNDKVNQAILWIR